MPTKETVKRKVTIDYSDTSLGLQEFEAEILYNRRNLDGSRIILIETIPTNEGLSTTSSSKLICPKCGSNDTFYYSSFNVEALCLDCDHKWEVLTCK